jgi:hypothetical protein
MRRLAVVLVVTACARGSETVDAPPGNDGAIDGGVDGGIDAPAGGAAHLLLSEVALAPAIGEFVEIVNPTGSAVDLSTYYLSDNGNYFRLPTGAAAVDIGDFIVQFPAGAMIPAHGVRTVAIDSAANFAASTGVVADFSIGAGPTQMIAKVVSGTPALTASGELVVLFQWDGQSDLVHDVDILLAGVPSASDQLVDKSNVTQDGPDADTQPSRYAVDARTMIVQASVAPPGKSTKRIALEANHETHGGTGNGITGDDETSEDTTKTWDFTYTAATPGQVPAAIQ